MGQAFEREDRYIVIKRKHLARLPAELQIRLKQALEDATAFLDKIEGLVVESDWPEYEPTWQAIEARVTGSDWPGNALPPVGETVVFQYDDMTEFTYAGLESGVLVKIIMHFDCTDQTRAAAFLYDTPEGVRTAQAVAGCFKPLIQATAKPEPVTEAAPEWDGTGEPPTGLEVMYRSASWKEWVPCTVLCYGDSSVFLEETDAFGEQLLSRNGLSFKPLQTPETLARERREKAVGEMRKAVSAAGNMDLPEKEARTIFEALYDAGLYSEASE